MDTERRPPSISVVRTIVIRVHQQLDPTGLEQLQRILHDLIEDQGVGSLIVDLSAGVPADSPIAAILASAKADIERGGGMLELRIPVDSPPELIGLAEQIPTFRPLESSRHRTG